MVKVKEDMTGWKMWEHGVPDSRLTVIRQAEDYISPSGIHYAQWLCECNCENHTKIIVAQKSLKQGITTSCGCVVKELLSQRSKKYNRYEQKNNIVIGYSSNTDDLFYVDLKNFEKIKDICWYVVVGTNNGVKRLMGYDTKNKKTVLMHQLLGFKNYDHIDMNELNNLESNLRQCNASQNCMNRHRQKHNISGYIGVSWRDDIQKWRVRISVDKQEITIGHFVDKEDAIKARLNAELLYYGEFAPQRHLFEQYEIEVKDYAN